MRCRATSGVGLQADSLSGTGMQCAGSGNGHGLALYGDGTGDGLTASGGGSGVDIDADITGDITGNLSGSVGSVTTVSDKTGYSLAADQSGVTIGTCNTNTDMRGTDNAATAADVNTQVSDVIKTDTASGPSQAAPPADASLETKIAYLYQKLIRSKVDFDKSTGVENTYEDGGSTIAHKRTVSVAGNVTTKSAAVTGA